MTRGLLLLVTLLHFTACAGTSADGDGGRGGAGGIGGMDSGGEGGDAAPRLTYHRDAKPIFDAKCGSCHTAGGIGPYALETYEQVEEALGSIKLAVSTGRMPPWPVADGCAEYVGDRSLDPEQKQTLLDWIAEGAHEGDPATAVTKPLAPSGLSRVDLTLRMKEPYVPRLAPDDYRCFLIDWPQTSTTYITGFRALPGSPSIVHHVIAYYAAPDQVAAYEKLDANEEGPGYTCFGNASGAGTPQWLAAWAPGTLGSDFPAGTGIKVEPGAKVVLQVHYNTLATGAIEDLTAMDFKIDPTVEREAAIMPFANPMWLMGRMPIPADEPDVVHKFEFDMAPYLSQVSNGALTSNAPYVLYDAGLHMHTLGTEIRTKIVRADGTDECLADVPAWDFHWQGSYGFAEPKVVQPGDKLYLECHYDNTIENQRLVDKQPVPPQDVNWGDGTTDEMCLATFFVTNE